MKVGAAVNPVGYVTIQDRVTAASSTATVSTTGVLIAGGRGVNKGYKYSAHLDVIYGFVKCEGIVYRRTCEQM